MNAPINIITDWLLNTIVGVASFCIAVATAQTDTNKTKK
jgi:hypothetical protein